MKWSVIERGMLLAMALLLGDAEPVRGQQPEKDLYGRRVERYTRAWQKLIPSYQKLQFAGSMGLVSVGFGWDYGRHNFCETDLLVGFVPKFYDDRAKITLTLKQNFMPWTLRIRDSKWSVEPLACGIYLNTILDRRFWIKEPERYPHGYYRFSSRIRIHLFAGQRFSLDLSRRHPNKSVTFFYELSSCDLYIVSRFTNRYLGFTDMVKLSFGVKLQVL